MREQQDHRTSTIDAAEVARFAELAATWWDPAGEQRALHKLNPVRLHFIRDHLARHFGRDIRAVKPFSGLRLLDIGCGGGLVSEPMARLGFAVTGIDAGANMLAIARSHAAEMGLAIDYRQSTVEDLAATGTLYDAALALEVVEHVADPALFFDAAARLVAPGGAVIASTINRTAKAFLLAVVGAEYIMGWLPRGTHDWRKFRRPSELASALRAQGLAVAALNGLSYAPATGSWHLSDDLDVDYLLYAHRQAQPPISKSPCRAGNSTL
jgi:2-polyprenyl-6-hydroxyphenyl methylase / 3-demethylubiquinone-9 3-methyltransferase